MTTFTRRLGKFNFKKLTEVNTTSTINLLYYKGWGKISEILKEFSALENGMHGYHAGVVYGKPNSILKECENSPGVWVFDFSNGITLFMFSDGFRKDNYKGTSYEVEIKEGVMEKHVIESLKSFFDDFQKKFKEQYPEDFEKFKMFSKI
ncbi:hypothetical protein GW796_08295 [archaeon]|nr:hypothetical protein [archaeon]